jgi:hypothetical protein
MIDLSEIKQQLIDFSVDKNGAATVDFVTLMAAVIIISFATTSGLASIITTALLNITLG